jgi:hypothetical protein
MVWAGAIAIPAVAIAALLRVSTMTAAATWTIGTWREWRVGSCRLLWVRVLLGRMGTLVRSIVRTVGVRAKVFTERALSIGIIVAAWRHGAGILGS